MTLKESIAKDKYWKFQLWIHENEVQSADCNGRQSDTAHANTLRHLRVPATLPAVEVLHHQFVSRAQRDSECMDTSDWLYPGDRADICIL